MDSSHSLDTSSTPGRGISGTFSEARSGQASWLRLLLPPKFMDKWQSAGVPLLGYKGKDRGETQGGLEIDRQQVLGDSSPVQELRQGPQDNKVGLSYLLPLSEVSRSPSYCSFQEM